MKIHSNQFPIGLLSSILVIGITGTSQVVVADSPQCLIDSVSTLDQNSNFQIAESLRNAGYECTLRVFRAKPLGGGDPTPVTRVCRRGTSSEFTRRELLTELNEICQEEARRNYQGVGENRYYCESIHQVNPIIQYRPNPDGEKPQMDVHYRTAINDSLCHRLEDVNSNRSSSCELLSR